MATDSKDTLGDRLKALERIEAGRCADSNLPLMARLDGRAFHTFTQGLKRPYDQRLSDLMVDTTKYLIEKTHAVVGYTQSDEISLCWMPYDPRPMTQETAGYMFDGKFQKLTSVLSSLATGYFVKHLAEAIPEKAHEIPSFDCRIWNVPTVRDAYLNFLWRQDDAIKNSISMAAQARFSHRVLHGVNGEQKRAKLQEIGAPWEAEPGFFKWGTFLQRQVRPVVLSEEELDRITAKYRPTGPVMRGMTVDLGLGPLRELEEPSKILFKQ